MKERKINVSKLKTIRENQNISRSQLSKTSGIAVRSIEGYEQGLRDINKAQGIILYNLSRALNCKIEDLLEIKKDRG